MATDDNGGTDVRKVVFSVFAVLTAAGIVLSMVAIDQSIPPRIYVFGFLGATVYVFTSLAEKFDAEGRYALEVASKGAAAFPLAAGVYLLAFAFPLTDGSASNQPTDRIVSGLVFLSGTYVSLTLRALGAFARRMLGVSEAEEEARGVGDDGDGQREQTDDDQSDGNDGEESRSEESRDDDAGDGEESREDDDEGTG
jgi:hypothetical protein